MKAPTWTDEPLTVNVPEDSRDPIDTIVVLELDKDAVSIEPINLWKKEEKSE